MVRFVPVVLLAALASSVAGAPAATKADAVLDLQKKGRPQLDAAIAKSKTCTKEKLEIRREWGDLSADDRKSYIAAMLCLMSKPPKLTQFAGVTNRYEDFVAVHINQTLQIHGTGSFLSWHRYYTWSFERALQTECGYNGTQPYWDWGRWAADPETSPIFDGSDTSLSGNGQKITHKGQSFGPAGNGGGCVTTGPFKNMTVHLGPFAPAADPAPPKNPAANGMGKNSRCLRRDISNYLTSHYGRTEDIAALITGTADIGSFQTQMQNTSPTGGMGVHGVGHFTIAGDPGADFYNSPNDPAFFVHHGMIDRTWSIWQTQQLANRTEVIAGGTSMMGFGRLQSLDDVVDLGVAAYEGKTYKIRELTSTVDGPFCYTYE
ncbi:putative domain, di-copper centre [Niveomyces insectorum RCEF 264]|uniref:Putative domain, di-copper centre n=1 Tax=Niveomyces insectorum RCEF 264 TaxID=1081102 RepID=A0A167TEZ2_9HYPO|nr:putative domain, di-copper centre [Niveomyces insectorum RCEF 264]